MAFVAKYICKSCRESLTREQVLRSNGVCPRCGYVSDGTVVDYEKVAVEVDEPSYRKSLLRRVFR